MTPSPTPLVIPKRSKLCFGTEKSFEPGTEVFSVVHLQTDGELIRKDYCPTYWFDQGEETLIKDSWGYWKVKIPDRKKNPLTKHEHAMVLLNDLIETKGKEGLTHLFAQYLFRNKHLAPCFGKKKKAQRDFTYYEVPQTGEVLAVLKVSIKKEELSVLEGQLIELVKTMHDDEQDEVGATSTVLS
jgi:hypothetical protein